MMLLWSWSGVGRGDETPFTLPHSSHADAAHPGDPVHGFTMGPPVAVDAHLEACSRLTMPETASAGSALAGSTRSPASSSTTSWEQAQPAVTKARASRQQASEIELVTYLSSADVREVQSDAVPY